MIELKDIGSIKKENITSRFLDRSIEIKIHDFKGENLIFAVPRTQCKVNTELSKFFLKQDKLIISIRKVKKEDNWFSVYKTKTIGGDSD